MSLKILLDMNLSPSWITALAREGWSAVHWSAIGDHGAPDEELVEWAYENQHILFTHDLDFSRLLALNQHTGPSVIQVRGQDILPDQLGPMVITAIHRFEPLLRSGALVVIDQNRARARALPLR